jgi:hypothetical protein
MGADALLLRRVAIVSGFRDRKPADFYLQRVQLVTLENFDPQRFCSARGDAAEFGCLHRIKGPLSFTPKA